MAPKKTASTRKAAFPILALRAGKQARRRTWGEGFHISLGTTNAKGGGKPCFLLHGNRAGTVEWKPADMTSDIIAADWELVTK